MATSFDKLTKRAADAEKRLANSPGNDAKALTSVGGIVDNDDIQLELPLELLGQGARGAPDSVLRSALFAASRPGKRRHLDDEKIASVSNVTIRQTGQQLQQIDLDVWIELIRLAAESQSSIVHVPLRGLLRRMSRDTGIKSRERVLSTLRRLNATVVGISDGIREYHGSLIYEHMRDEETQHLVVRLNPRIASLFDRSSWSHLQLSQRHKLKRQPLAQWLHGYLSSHDQPFPIRVDTLRELSGSNTRALNHFRAELRGAMEKVKNVTGWGWSIDKRDRLVVAKLKLSPNSG